MPPSLMHRAPLQMAHPPLPKRGSRRSCRRHVVELEWFVLSISLFGGQQASLWGRKAAYSPTPYREQREGARISFAPPDIRKPCRGPAAALGPERSIAGTVCSVRGAILGDRSRGVDQEPERQRLGAGMEIGRQISMPGVWAEEKD
jgi:hypothetical protein